MSRLRNSPRVPRGAIVAIDSTLPKPTVIAFQYNPTTLKRTLKPNTASKDSAKPEAQRIDLPPTETITLDAEFDATDGLDEGNPIAVQMGIYPQLSALETLLYPPKTRLIDNGILSMLGMVEIIPPMAPLTLFVWGPKRVQPVRIDSLTIDETAYDDNLNPIQAKVSITLIALSSADFCGSDMGANIYLAHQGIKEAMALVGSASSLANLF